MFKTIRDALTNLFNKKEEGRIIRKWTKEQESQLVGMLKAKMTKERICSITGRSENSINSKLIQMYGSSNVKVLDRTMSKKARGRKAKVSV